MQALVKYEKGVGNVELRDIPKPVPKANEVLIKIRAAAICGTDIHIYQDHFPSSPPLTIGHEFSGTVEDLGASVTEFKLGEKVVAENNPLSCGACKVCLLDYPNMCLSKKAFGIHSEGCFAEYMTLPESLLHRIPDSFSFGASALIEPLAIAHHVVADRCGVNTGDYVVVLGAGAIGLLAAQVARSEGAGRILLTGTSPDEAIRFKCAADLGINTINVEENSLEEKINDETKGQGVDVVIEASGNPNAISQGVNILRRNGRMGVTGITGKSHISLDWDMMLSKGIEVIFAYGARRKNWESSIQLLLKEEVLTEPLITGEYAIEEWETAFQKMENLEAIRSVFKINSPLSK